MTLDLHAITLDAHDPERLAAFWGGLLRWPAVHDPLAPAGATALRPDDDNRYLLRFVPDEAPKVVANRGHVNVTSDAEDDQQATVARALSLGGRHHDVGQLPEEDHVVLADPEGNELCVIPPGNAFLAGCGKAGDLACDGTRAVGVFWSEVLGWPLVWDQDEETAVQAPWGGTKITWGGPPLPPKPGKNRVHLDVVPTGGASQQDEVHRLLGLGASHADIGQGDVPWVVLADPDGNELCVLPDPLRRTR